MSRTIGLRSRLLLTTVPLVLVATALLAFYLLQVARELYVTGSEAQLLGQSRLVAGTAAGVCPHCRAAALVTPTILHPPRSQAGTGTCGASPRCLSANSRGTVAR